jgi:hypothetical protein
MTELEDKPRISAEQAIRDGRARPDVRKMFATGP